MKFTSSGLDYSLQETPREVTVVTLYRAISGNVWPSVYIDYQRGKDAVAQFLRERRKHGERWRTIEWHGTWTNNKGDRLDRILIDEASDAPGVYE